MKKFKRVAFVFSLLFLVVTLSPAAAQAPYATNLTPVTTKSSTPIPSYNQQTITSIGETDIYANLDASVPRNLRTLSQNVIIEVLAGTACLLSGRDPLNPADGRCLGIDQSGKITYVEQQSGIAQTMGSLMGGAFSIPVSGAGYTEYAMGNFGITKSAYAQTDIPSGGGLGYDRLKPLVNIWTRFRDIAYLAFVLAFTIIGLAIMFRVKIDARTVMTIQNQIPKIVIALILVTFSYAIAGFLIDMMYVIMYLIILAFSNLTSTNIDPYANIFTVINKSFSPGYNVPGIIGLTGEISLGMSKVFGVMVVNFLESTISSVFKMLFSPFQAISSIGCQALDLASTGGLAAVGYIPVVGGWFKSIPHIGGIFGGGGSCDFVEKFFQTFFIGLFTIITFIVILVAIIVSLFRAWFTIIKSFAYVLVDVIVGPLWIAAGVFPGSKLNFSTWIKHLMGHLSVFPTAFGVILLGKTIIDNVTHTSGLFSPPLVGVDIGGSTAVASFIGFGFIISIPSILDRVRKAIGAMDFGLTDIKRGFNAGKSVGGVATNYTIGNYSKVGKDGKLEQAQGLSKLGHAMGLIK